jgi:S1-C subfamily serine protease
VIDMMVGRVWLSIIAIVIGVLGGGLMPLSADDLRAIRAQIQQALPQQDLDRYFSAPPLVFRGAPARGGTIYRDRVNGVVLLASTKAVATGVLVSADGDIITNDHIVQDAHRTDGGDWVAVWFKPPPGVRADLGNFLLARVVQRNPRRDLARLRLAQALPATARVVPLAGAMPDVGEEVFVIGHPKTYAWSFGHGVVSRIHPDYHWRYDDGVSRAATAIQTESPINPGNSGGPLLNEQGAMVGVVVGSALDGEGAGFAVAVQHVHELLMAARR